MSTEVSTKPEQDAVEAQTRERWATMGVIVSRKEFELQLQAQASLSKIENMPTRVEDVPAAELALKEVRADQKIIESTRKGITGQFEAVTKRLMQAEKSFDVPITNYANAIIKVKNEYEKKEAEKKLKAQELKSIREVLATSVSHFDAAFKTKIANKVNAYYNWALSEGGITPDNLEAFLKKAGAKLTDADFTPQRPTISHSYATAAEVEALINELFTINPSDYTAKYIIELENRFQDYEIAYHCKKEALEIAKKELEERQQAIAVEQQHNVIAAQLDFASTPLDVQPAGFKALKKVYKINMPENEESAIKILSAYVANRAICSSKIRITKWLNFSVTNAITALEKAKCEDEKFQPAGIVFVETDKL